MFKKKNNSRHSLGEIRKLNNELNNLLKEIKKVAKNKGSNEIVNLINNLNVDLDFKSVVISNLSEAEIDDIYTLTIYLKKDLLDAQELLEKGTIYGTTLALNRALDMIKNRKLAKSPLLVSKYRDFEEGLFLIIKMRELAYGEISSLKEKIDQISLNALKEKDPTMRIRYFEDMKIIEKDILRLQNEAHNYDAMQTMLRNEDILKKIYKEYNVKKDELVVLNDFETAVSKYTK